MVVINPQRAYEDLHAIWFNPYGRDGKSLKELNALLPQLDRWGIPYVTKETFADDEKTIDHVREAAMRGYRGHLIWAGDGGSRICGTGLLQAKEEMGSLDSFVAFLMGGTAGNVAKASGTATKNWNELCRAIKVGQTFPYDVIVLDDETYSFNLAGAGFHGDVLWQRMKNRREEKFLSKGKVGYAPAIASCLLDLFSRTEAPQLTVDYTWYDEKTKTLKEDRIETAAWDMYLINTSKIASNVVFSSNILASDGEMDLVIFPQRNTLYLEAIAQGFGSFVEFPGVNAVKELFLRNPRKAVRAIGKALRKDVTFDENLNLKMQDIISNCSFTNEDHMRESAKRGCVYVQCREARMRWKDAMKIEYDGDELKEDTDLTGKVYQGALNSLTMPRG